jgi:multimeric flavodoxin WrbA
MKRLIINTISGVTAEDENAVNVDDYKIGACIGCTHCWLKTPGVCALKDDWEMLFKKILKADAVIWVTEEKLGFISHTMKNIVDRIRPIAAP